MKNKLLEYSALLKQTWSFTTKVNVKKCSPNQKC